MVGIVFKKLICSMLGSLFPIFSPLPSCLYYKFSNLTSRIDILMIGSILILKLSLT